MIVWYLYSVRVRVMQKWKSECVGGSPSLPGVWLDGADLLCNCFEHLFDACAFLRGHLWPDHFVLLSKLDGTLLANPLLLNRNVTLIACQRHNESILICSRVCLHFIDPVFDRLKRSLVSQIVANYCPNCITIVHVDHRAEAFMTTCIPNMHLHLLLGTWRILRVLNAYYFLEVGAANRDIMHLVKAVLTEAQSDGWLSYGWVTQKDYLCFNLTTRATTSGAFRASCCWSCSSTCSVRRWHSHSIFRRVSILTCGRGTTTTASTFGLFCFSSRCLGLLWHFDSFEWYIINLFFNFNWIK